MEQIDKVRVERDKWKIRAENILEVLNDILRDEYNREPAKMEEFDNGKES